MGSYGDIGIAYLIYLCYSSAKEEGSNMREELKYPIVYALQKMTKEAYENYNSFDEVIGYIVSPCYLVEEHLTYYEDGTSKKTYDVVFPRSVDGIYYDTIDNDFIPKYNVFNGYTNTTTVDYITFDYEEAIKKRNIMIKENVFNGINLFLPLEPLETYNDRCGLYMEKIEKYQQRLNKAEPIEQVKEKIKTPLK